MLRVGIMTAENPMEGRSPDTRDQDDLWSHLLSLAAVAEDAFKKSVQSFLELRPELAGEVRDAEKEIDASEVTIEHACVRFLALYSPVATDLRQVATAFKANADIERMADLATHIAKRARKRAREIDPAPIPPSVVDLAALALTQVRDGISVLTSRDSPVARAVVEADRRVDKQLRKALKQLKREICRQPDQLDSWFRIMNTARNLERAADHASNISKAVVFLTEGDIMRHSAE
jgi:phosphate transport system protein